MSRRPCVGKVSGRSLRKYFSRSEAEIAAEEAAARHGREQVPYRCRRCEWWHLQPKERHTPSTTCDFCTSGCGVPKQSYPSEEIAERRARIAEQERGIWLVVYPCPEGLGWHLTKA